MQIRIFLSQFCICIEHEFFFAGHGAGRDPYPWPCTKKFCELRSNRFGRVGGVILEISKYCDFLRIGSEHLNSLPVRFGLHANDGVVLEHASQPSPDKLVSRERFVRDAAIYHHDSNSPVAAFPKKIRPDLGLRDDDHLRVDAIQCPYHAPGQVDGKVKGMVDNVVPLACERLSGGSNCGDDQRFVGELPP